MMNNVVQELVRKNGKRLGPNTKHKSVFYFEIHVGKKPKQNGALNQK